jgi:hypothetical protein
MNFFRMLGPPMPFIALAIAGYIAKYPTLDGVAASVIIWALVAFAFSLWVISGIRLYNEFEAKIKAYVGVINTIKQECGKNSKISESKVASTERQTTETIIDMQERINQSEACSQQSKSDLAIAVANAKSASDKVQSLEHTIALLTSEVADKEGQIVDAVEKLKNIKVRMDDMKNRYGDEIRRTMPTLIPKVLVSGVVHKYPEPTFEPNAKYLEDVSIYIENLIKACEAQV